MDLSVQSFRQRAYHEHHASFVGRSQRYLLPFGVLGMQDRCRCLQNIAVSLRVVSAWHAWGDVDSVAHAYVVLLIGGSQGYRRTEPAEHRLLFAAILFYVASFEREDLL